MACAGVVAEITGGLEPRRRTYCGFAVVDGEVDAKGCVAPKSGVGKRKEPLMGACESP